MDRGELLTQVLSHLVAPSQISLSCVPLKDILNAGISSTELNKPADAPDGFNNLLRSLGVVRDDLEELLVMVNVLAYRVHHNGTANINWPTRFVTAPLQAQVLSSQDLGDHLYNVQVFTESSLNFRDPFRIIYRGLEYVSPRLKQSQHLWTGPSQISARFRHRQALRRLGIDDPEDRSEHLPPHAMVLVHERFLTQFLSPLSSERKNNAKDTVGSKSIIVNSKSIITFSKGVPWFTVPSTRQFQQHNRDISIYSPNT
jgi:hypothetical protein